MTLETAVILLILAVAGIVLTLKFLRKKPKLRIICLILLSLIALHIFQSNINSFTIYLVYNTCISM